MPRLSILALTLLAGLAPFSAWGQEKSAKEYAAALTDKDARIRLSGLMGLANAGAEAAPHVEAIAKLLKDPSVQVRRGAAFVLNVQGEDAEKAAPSLAAALRDSDSAVKQIAFKALIEMGPKSIPALQTTLAEPDITTRTLAVMALDTLAADYPEALKGLALALKDGNIKIRTLAVLALTRVTAKDNKEVFDGLALALSDNDANIRAAAAYALLETDKAAAVMPLLKALANLKPDVRRTAIQALGSIGDELEMPGMLALRTALSDSDPRVRQFAAAGIAKAGIKARELGEGKKVSDALFKLMTDKDGAVRQTAVYALGQVGIDDKEEIKQLAAGLKDTVPSIRGYTLQALAQYSHEEAPEDWRLHVVGYIAEGLKDRDKRIALVAAKILVEQKSFAVPSLTKLVETATGPPRFYAAQVLAEIGEDAKAAVPALRKMSVEGPVEHRQAALTALQKIAP